MTYTCFRHSPPFTTEDPDEWRQHLIGHGIDPDEPMVSVGARL